MITTITLILSFLVMVNFLLLIFSSNKTPKSKQTKKPYIIKNTDTTIHSIQLGASQLAATGS